MSTLTRALSYILAVIVMHAALGCQAPTLTRFSDDEVRQLDHAAEVDVPDDGVYRVIPVQFKVQRYSARWEFAVEGPREQTAQKITNSLAMALAGFHETSTPSFLFERDGSPIKLQAVSKANFLFPAQHAQYLARKSSSHGHWLVRAEGDATLDHIVDSYPLMLSIDAVLCDIDGAIRNNTRVFFPS
jgi:hypothetical protein